MMTEQELLRQLMRDRRDEAEQWRLDLGASVSAAVVRATNVASSAPAVSGLPRGLAVR